MLGSALTAWGGREGKNRELLIPVDQVLKKQFNNYFR
jgi:hypothetical protein